MKKLSRSKPLSALLVLVVACSGCATYKPHPFSEVASGFIARAQTKTIDKTNVTIAVLDDKEGKKLFGSSLSKKGIQPVWIKVDNNSDDPDILIQHSIDPNYYSFDEAAYLCHYKRFRRFVGQAILSVFVFPVVFMIPVDFFMTTFANNKMNRVFSEQAFNKFTIEPHESSSGFVFTTLDEGTKQVHVDLYGQKRRKSFYFTVSVPGIIPDYTTKDIANRCPENVIKNYSAEELPEILRNLPCCTSNKKGDKNGDPINLVVVGELEDVIAVFTSAKWDQTEALSFKSAMKMAKAFFTGDHYRYAPISPLYYHGLSHDVGLQKTRGNINNRLHLRLWYTSMRLDSTPVWVGSVSRDIGVRPTLKTWYFTTHKIDPDIDDARDYVLADLVQLEKVARYGFVMAGDPVPSSRPQKNLTGDDYYTDGERLVIELSRTKVALENFS